MTNPTVFKSKAIWDIPYSLDTDPVFDILTTNKNYYNDVGNITTNPIKTEYRKGRLSFNLEPLPSVRNIYVKHNGSFTNTLIPDIKKDGVWVGNSLKEVYVNYQGSWILVWRR